MPARADDDKDRPANARTTTKAYVRKSRLYRRRWPLQSPFRLQDQVNALETANTNLQNEINSLQASNTTLQNQLAHAKNVLALDPFVSVDPNPEIGVIGPNIIFSGANIHIVSGSGATDDNGNPTGLGNLIIGYDEDPESLSGSDAAYAARWSLSAQPGDRGGSHNLVIGRGNRFTQAAFGGLVAGELNTISNVGASVSGGIQQHRQRRVRQRQRRRPTTPPAASSPASAAAATTPPAARVASVSGGFINTASGVSRQRQRRLELTPPAAPLASVSGGSATPQVEMERS